MALMFCHSCYQINECNVESPQPSKRHMYFEEPYINAYVRKRTCSSCKETFVTYEISEASFFALRKIVELNRGIFKFIDKTWSNTKLEFDEKHGTSENNKIDINNSSEQKIDSLLDKKIINLNPKLNKE